MGPSASAPKRSKKRSCIYVIGIGRRLVTDCATVAKEQILSCNFTGRRGIDQPSVIGSSFMPVENRSCLDLCHAGHFAKRSMMPFLAARM